MTFRDFVEVTRDALQSLALSRLDGDRDLTPMLHLDTPHGITIATVQPWFFESSDGTQLLAERVIVPMIAENDARKVAWTFCAWAAPSEGQRPSEHPDRREILLATFIDPEVVEHWAAPLVRTGGPVVVGAWIPSLPNVGGGPLTTAIQEALR